jgi:TIR domain
MNLMSHTVKSNVTILGSIAALLARLAALVPVLRGLDQSDRPPGVFISYRRSDTGPYARLLKAELAGRFPRVRVFMDLDAIEPGLDFAEIIRDAVSTCHVMVVLIGRQWATATDGEGRRRLDDPDDYVRAEIRAALIRSVRVIPVLIDGAQPLLHQHLPSDLRKLTRLNVLEMSYDRYPYDATRLNDIIERVLAAKPHARTSSTYFP